MTAKELPQAVIDIRAKFAKLTRGQHRLVLSQGSDQNVIMNRSKEKMCERLLALGLVEKRTRAMSFPDGLPPMMITWYEVPIPIHMAYCQWCSDTCTDEELANA